MTDFELTLDERQDRIIEILAEGVLALITRCNSYYAQFLFLTFKDMNDGVFIQCDELLIEKRADLTEVRG